MNEFSLVNRADAEVQRDIDGWLDKIREYLRDFFENDIERTLGTEFGDCISKVIYLADRAVADPDTFRGVRDVQGRLQAGAIVAPYFNYLDVDAFTNAPWNVLKNQPETIKGAATSLMAELVNESFELGMMGRIKLIAIERAKSFYRSRRKTPCIYAGDIRRGIIGIQHPYNTQQYILQSPQM